jgi:hypothetical protein
MDAHNPFEAPLAIPRDGPTPMMWSAMVFGTAAAVSAFPFAYMIADGLLDICVSSRAFRWEVFLTIWLCSTIGGAVAGWLAWRARQQPDDTFRGSGALAGALVPFPAMYIAFTACGLVAGLGSSSAEDVIATVVGMSVLGTIFAGPLLAPVGALTGWALDRWMTARA